MKQHSEASRPIYDDEVATYVVCPEAWRLKRLQKHKAKADHHAKESHAIRKDWVKNQELSSQLKQYTIFVYCLLVLLAILIFLLEQSQVADSSTIPAWFNEPLSSLKASGIAKVPTEIMLLLMIVGAVIFLWDFFDRTSKKLRRSGGFDPKTETVELHGSKSLPSETLVSENLGLRSKPDALVREGRVMLPLNLEPKAKKIHDRHIVRLFVALLILEDKYGAPPEFGILVVGDQKRRVKIANTEEKRRWVRSLIEEMRSIEAGTPALPSPQYYKCTRCDVKHICDHSADGAS